MHGWMREFKLDEKFKAKQIRISMHIIVVNEGKALFF